MPSVGGLADRLRQPEYVGENRCTPCTVLNLAMALLLAEALVVLAWPAGASTALGLGGVALLFSLATIYLRGYLVPGTPWLTKRYLPERVLRAFDKAPPAGGTGVMGEGRTGDGGGTSTVDVEAVLVDAGALEPCRDEDDLCLDDAFRRSWDDEIESLSEGASLRRRAAELFEVEPGEIDVLEREEARVVRHGDRMVGHWPSAAAARADLAATEVLADRVADWNEMAPTERGELLYGLRLFLETCPDCGGEVRMGEETVQSCCRSVSVVSVSCTDCDARILEVEHPDG